MKSLADVVGASGLSGYAELALLVFFITFIAVGIRALTADRAAMDHAARLPLDDDRIADAFRASPDADARDPRPADARDD